MGKEFSQRPSTFTDVVHPVAKQSIDAHALAVGTRDRERKDRTRRVEALAKGVRG